MAKQLFLSLLFCCPLVLTAQTLGFFKGVQVSPTFSITYNTFTVSTDYSTFYKKIVGHQGLGIGLEMVLSQTRNWELSIEPNLNYYEIDIIDLQYNLNFGSTFEQNDPGILIYSGNLYETMLLVQLAVTNKIRFGKKRRLSTNFGLEWKHELNQQSIYSETEIQNQDLFFFLGIPSPEQFFYNDFNSFRTSLSFEIRNIFETPIGTEIGLSHDIPFYSQGDLYLLQFFFKMKFLLN